ncbi:uncharacterized protein LOC129941391 [Eupeodes corollae]|uniref:uncharacterized protein LOC129941391 n=1 Tax=Eupeodes corollae TaxID=290404 RepID=UPI002491E284|nr:uncharacterized protein LOC129941391 [Eupeodes corollae]
MFWLKFEFFKMCGIILFILWVYLLSVVEGKHLSKRGLMENINNGIKYAGQMMGINTAADVANLVAKAFARQQPPAKQFDAPFLFQTPGKIHNSDREYDTASSFINTTDMVGGLLRMLGFDAGKLGALAINAILMIAQLIGTNLKRRDNPMNFSKSTEDGKNFDESQHEDDEPYYDGPQDDRTARGGNIHDHTPLDWILTNPPEGLSDFIEQITDRKLPDKLVEAIGKLEAQPGQGDCIKLLMCKSAPFIWGMQNSVSKRLNDLPKDSNEENYKSEQPMSISVLFKNLPDLEEYRKHGQQCERHFSKFCKKNDS